MNRFRLDQARRQLKHKYQRKIFDDVASLPLSRELIVDRQGRHDAQSLVIFTRQLEHVMTEVEEEEFAELKMANQEMIPFDTSIPEGAETFTYYLYSSAGVARFIAAYSGQSLPMVTIEAARVTGNIEPFANAFGWTTRDIRNSQFAGIPLESESGVAARRAHMELLNDTGMWGREDLGLPGLFNHPNITVSDAADNGGGSTLWVNKNGDQIAADVNSVINSVDEISFGMEKVNRVEIARPQYNLIKTTRMTTGGSADNITTTILKHLEEIHSDVDFRPCNELVAAESDGNLTTNALFAYTAGNKRKASLVVPMMFRQMPVQQRDLTFVVPAESSTGGVKMPRPLMCHRMEGIG